MNFLLPGAFALSALALVIIALYLLKLRRIEHRVSSTYLWRRFIQDREANAPWQKLHLNWLMLLQLLFLMLLIIALARPYLVKEGISGQSVVIILDSSASMSAIDVAPNRFEAARKRARQIISDLPENTRLTVIEAGYDTRMLVSSSQDRAQALQAVDGIHPGMGESDIALALELASAIASRHTDAQIVLLSDGGSPIPENLVLRGKLNYLPVGIGEDNQAISLVNVEPSSTGGSSVFIQLANYHSEPVQRRLEVYTDGILVQATDIDLPANGMESVVITGVEQGVRQIEARLDGNDDLALDDQAFAVVQESQTRRVALVSDGNYFLKTALGLLPAIELIEVDMAALQDINVDAIILDGVVPDALPESGNIWFIAPERSSDLFEVAGRLENPELRIQDSQDFFVSNITLKDVHVLDAVVLPLPDWGVPVITGASGNAGTNLLFRGEPDGRRVAVMAFDLKHTDLPLNVAFPILCANMMEWLAPGTVQDSAASIQPGQDITLPDGVREAMVYKPDGSNERIRTDEEQLVFTNTQQLGLYHITWDDDGELDVAVNLYSPRESNVKTVKNLSGFDMRQGENDDIAAQMRKEYWRWLAVPALLTLMLEWILFYRAGAKRLLHGVRSMIAHVPVWRQHGKIQS